MIRIVIGLGLVLGGIVLYGGTNTDLSSAGAAVIAAGIVAAGAGLIFAPRLAATREALDEARRERIRAEEQEAMAARIHDSVLQTLALIEREAEPGSRAAALARRQERELRGVLYGEQRPGEHDAGGALMREIAARVEEQHGIKVELVQTRDGPLDAGDRGARRGGRRGARQRRQARGRRYGQRHGSRRRGSGHASSSATAAPASTRPRDRGSAGSSGSIEAGWRGSAAAPRSSPSRARHRGRAVGAAAPTGEAGA